MKAKRREKLIISLIEDDLIHSKLVEGLIELGLKAEDYFLNLSDTIICLMGFEGKRNEQLFEYYLDLLKQAKYVENSENNNGFKKLAAIIYHNLLLKGNLK